MAKGQEFVRVAEFITPFGKDGFLAVNSLLAFVVILSRVFSSDDPHRLPQQLAGLLGTSDLQNFLNASTEGNLGPVLERETMIVLYGLDTKSAAVDLESKFTESALGRIQLSDFRNFGHGRHHWLAKRNRESAVLALCSPGDLTLAEKTLSLLPKNIPRAIANFPQEFPDRSIAAMVYAILVFASLSHQQKNSLDKFLIPVYFLSTSNSALPILVHFGRPDRWSPLGLFKFLQDRNGT